MTNKVLFIDDEQFILQTVQRKLKQTDIEVFVANDGHRGISIMESEEISVVFTDLIMPKINGLHVTEQIHKINPNAVIVVLSGNSSADIITKTMNTHMVYKYLTKPWKIDAEGIDFIRECLAEADRREQQSLMMDGDRLYVDICALSQAEGHTWMLKNNAGETLMTSSDYFSDDQFSGYDGYQIIDSSRGPLRLYAIRK